MKINDVVLGLAAGVGVDLSPDGKTAYYVEWSIGELSVVDVGTGMVTTTRTGLSYPEDVEVDWKNDTIFVSERTNGIKIIGPGDKSGTILLPGSAPQQLDLKWKGKKRILYTVCYDTGELLRIDVDANIIKTIKKGLGHPVGIAVDTAQKYAYVTEQDNNILSRIELATGSSTKIIGGLVAPFFLAWDQSAKGLFCVQRDPSNSLILITLGYPATIKTVANGLAWRPSGVAPDASNSLIYICADRELEVISFNGAPPIKPPKPTLEIYSIRFNFDGSSAIQLKDHISGSPIPLPEYIKSTRNGPAAYLLKAKPKVKVVLRKLTGYVPGAYAIGATGNFGGIRRKMVTPVFQASGLSDPIDFEFLWPLPAVVGKPSIKLIWYARSSPGPSVPVSIGSDSHKIYVILSKPTDPWKKELPWVAGLEIACGWAAGASTAADAAAGITKGYYNCGMVKYDTVHGSTFYGNGTFAFSDMLDRLNGGPGLGQKVNCTDSACTVSTFANLVGCDLWQSQMGYFFDLNPILAIGCPLPNPCPTWSGFRYHEVAWLGACTETENLFDGCLMVNNTSKPGSSPYVWLLPTDMLFGDCSTMNYRLRLCPKGNTGCGACQPQTTTRQRRPVT